MSYTVSTSALYSIQISEGSGVRATPSTTTGGSVSASERVSACGVQRVSIRIPRSRLQALLHSLHAVSDQLALVAGAPPPPPPPPPPADIDMPSLPQ